MKILSKFTVSNLINVIGNKNEVDEIITKILIGHRIFGQHILDPNWTWRRSSLNHFVTLILMTYVLFGTCDVIKNTKEVQLIAEACYTLVIIIACISKMFIYANKRYVFRKLYVEAKTSVLQIIKTESKENFTAFLKNVQMAVFIHIFVIAAPTLSYIIAALWFYINGNRITLSKSTSILMPMTTPYYEIGFFLHIVFMTFVGFTVMIADFWFVFLMLFYCTASDSITKKLEVKKRRSNEDNVQYANNLNERLQIFYTVHIIIIEYLNTMREMFKWLVLVPLGMVTFGICVILLMSKEMNWIFASNLIPLFIEIFVFNWFGEQVNTKAYNLYMALLHFDWLKLSHKNRKSYHIIMSYMNKNFVMKTAIGNELSFITMTAVLKAGYQAFTVFQSMDD